MVTYESSLLAQESTGTSGSGISQDSPNTQADSAVSLSSRHDFTASTPSFTLKRPSWPSSNAVPMSSGKGKQPAGANENESRSLIFPLFDRDDYLLTRSDSDHDEDGSDGEFEMIDPRLLDGSRSGSIGSPMDISRSRRLSPEKQHTIRSIHATPLRQRQPVVNSIRIHNNLNIRNLFGNMPFSSSVRTNNYPDDIQTTQVNNLFLPIWSMMVVNSKPGPGSLKYAFSAIIEEGTAMIERGTPVDLVIESHPNIAALFDEEQYQRSGIVSKWAAGMVHSMMLQGKLVY
jgi:hypothetical protein